MGLSNFIYDLKSSWHVGRGSKYEKKENYSSALKHYQIALEYHRKSTHEERPTGIVEMIALTYAKMNNFVQARIYAENALTIYSKHQDENNPKDIFAESANRMKNLLKDIGNIQSK